MKSRKLFHAICTILASAAVLIVSTASLLWVHQPKVPNELLNK
ncbi:cyclic lactone autoinducer peptide [Paenibacillus sambharensis]|uniref:Cyclic lactone autoinducer peptide n=1 Tax=Paenibacillus sambharensis TaxID=1803190 RepID=A0A2W1L9H0_9BACL|nr:cyclic lactone autoinducer peptide [Paenibacillus sambharensis]PZD95886.1 cyclic lactone autoinducer peptide [Paenibacillus sambharensis]